MSGRSQGSQSREWNLKYKVFRGPAYEELRMSKPSMTFAAGL